MNMGDVSYINSSKTWETEIQINTILYWKDRGTLYLGYLRESKMTSCLKEDNKRQSVKVVSIIFHKQYSTFGQTY
jgi:hypothetical protein